MAKAFDGNFIALVRRMEAAHKHLDELPDEQEWTQEQLSDLDDVRHTALHLAQVVEATIETFEGKPG